MRRRPTAIASALVTLAVVALFTACGGGHRYDARLVAADSLMWDAPDSALTVLGAIDSLGGEANRAYRDLLVTQARYKCYQEITTLDDSAISHAITYYRAHSGEREKLTRATLYKGAVMEELGHVDSAMFYYKTAEVNADEKDYTNLGQINTRIARMFRDYYSDMQICYEKYERALNYYRMTGNKRQQLICINNMGGCSGITRIGNTEKLLAQATLLAIELNDSSAYFKSQELLCRQLAFQGDSLSQAKQIALHCLNDYPTYINHDLILDLADIYVKSGMPDSAMYYLGYVTDDESASNPEQIKIRKYSILSRIAHVEGDETLSSHYDKLSHQVTDSIINNDQRYQILQIENSFNSRQHASILSLVSLLHWIILGLAVTTMLVIILLVLGHLHKMRRTKAIIKELQNVRTDDYDHLLNQLDSKNVIIEQFITNLVTLIKTVSGSEAHNSTSQLAQQIKETIVEIASDDFWCELQSYLDKKHNGLVSNLGQTHKLSKRDLQFIVLSCCGFPNAVVSIIMDYNPKYVFNKRKNLAKKMGLDMPLQDYLESLMAK